MLNKLLLFEAVGEIDDDILKKADERLFEKYPCGAKSTAGLGRVLKTVLIAAVIASLLAVTAYAADIFGIKALLMNRPGLKPQEAVKNPDGSLSWKDDEDGGFVSISQPMALPEEISPEIQKKIDNNNAAWAEWSEWAKDKAPKCPEAFSPPGDAGGMDINENADGTYSVLFYDFVKKTDAEGKPTGEFEQKLVCTKTATAEEKAEFDKYAELTATLGIPGYDFNYRVYSQEMADKLEETAAKYGLNIRHKMERYCGVAEGEQPNNAGTFSNAALIDKANAQCDGDFFNKEPAGIDKVYHYDEGTFCVSFYPFEKFSFNADDPMKAPPVSCYFYNSPYGTLSSGNEAFEQIGDVNAFNTRYYDASDGTHVTVLTNNDGQIFFYAYLENSFAAASIHSPKAMSDDEINSVIDFINLSAVK